MNTTVSTTLEHSTRQHPPQSPRHVAAVRRVKLADRVALRLGLALVTWSRRPRNAAAGHAQHESRLAREQQAERALRLNVPLR